MAISVGASALVLNKKGEILLTQRHDLQTWVFPGGMIAKNESPEKAAIREVEEETGLRINRRFPIPLDKLPSYVWRRTLGKKFGLVKL